MTSLPRIEFDAESHEYRVGGVRMPSVSEVLAKRLPDPYRCIDERTMAVARDRGVAVDEAIQAYLDDRLRFDTLPPDIQPYVKSYIRWSNAVNWQPVAVQARLHDPSMRVCGTLDEIGWLNGHLTIVDWKCTSQFHEKHAYQVGAYARMWRVQTGQRPEQGRVLILQKTGAIARAYPVELPSYEGRFMHEALQWWKDADQSKPA